MNQMNTDDANALSIEKPLQDFKTWTNLTMNPIVPYLITHASNNPFWYGSFVVPKGYNTSGTTKAHMFFLLEGTGNWSFDWTHVIKALTESLDVADSSAVVTTTANVNDAAVKVCSWTLTAADFAADDIVLWKILRDNATHDTVNGDVAILGVFFEYDDGG
jgi:hypothetical protein